MEKPGANEKIAQELEYFNFHNETAERTKGKPRRKLMWDANAEIIEYSVPNLENGQIRNCKKINRSLLLEIRCAYVSMR